MFEFIRKIFNYLTPMDEEAEVERAIAESPHWRASLQSKESCESQREPGVANGDSEHLESVSVVEDTTTTTITAMELEDEASGILSSPSDLQQPKQEQQHAVLNNTTGLKEGTMIPAPLAVSTVDTKAPAKRKYTKKKKATLANDSDAAPVKQQRKKATVEDTTSTLAAEETPAKRKYTKKKKATFADDSDAALVKKQQTKATVMDTTSTLAAEAPPAKRKYTKRKKATLADDSDAAPVKKQQTKATVMDTTSTLAAEAPPAKRKYTKRKKTTLADDGDAAPVKKQQTKATVMDTTSTMAAEAPPAKRKYTKRKKAILADDSDAAPVKKRVTMATTVKKEPIDLTSPLGQVKFVKGQDGLFHGASSPPPGQSDHVSQRVTDNDIPQQTYSNDAPKSTSKASSQQEANQFVFRASVKLEEPTKPQASMKRKIRDEFEGEYEEEEEEEEEEHQKRPSRSRAHKLGEYQCLICGSTFVTLEARDQHGKQDHPSDHTWVH